MPPQPDHQQHYFTADPASPGELREREVVLAGAPRTVVTAGGVFSADGIDKGTAVLLRQAPEPPETGRFVDLGCGWGPLALTLALARPEAQVDAVDVNRRALDLCRRNAERLGCGNVTALEPDQVPADRRYDLLWSNPPVRVGKAVLHGMLRQWLPRLAPGGRALLVVQRNLGADSLQAWLASTFAAGAEEAVPEGLAVERVASSKGFRLLGVTRP
ncbi:class I SAM-dependent methyltransferase [Ornithinicoccus halotolerans]|uniref:class I SAM-dependent methyltransferase n=1 Tax=Ornithinicoccus halotolerans TaxID=1748220 RepID=UPI001295C997|nr:methyltransferase [Ornithinicoccus halotolerans]